MADRSRPSTCRSSPEVTKAITSWLMPLAAYPNLAAAAPDAALGAGRTGDGLGPVAAEPGEEPIAAGDAAVSPFVEVEADGAPLSPSDGEAAGGAGHTSPQATATIVRTARRTARWSRRASTVTAGGGYRDWPGSAAIRRSAHPAMRIRHPSVTGPPRILCA